MKNLSLDDLYHMVSFVYGDRNAERDVTATFAHFVEVCGLIIANHRKRSESGITNNLCKALAWYFPLVSKFKINSLEDLIFRKYPRVCPYCRKEKHDSNQCKIVLGEGKSVDKKHLQRIYKKNRAKKPGTLDEWREMFMTIYPREPGEERSPLGLFEEIGELAEAIRVFDRDPKYFAGEAADVFTHLMGIANEQILRLKDPYSLEAEFLQRYPGLCVQCGYFICKCPPVPDATIGRAAKELEISPGDSLFKFDRAQSEKRAREVSQFILERLGGYATVARDFPLDRGETNKALVLLCLKLADHVGAKDQQLEKELREMAIRVAYDVKPAGSGTHAQGISEVVKYLQPIVASLGLELFRQDKSFPSQIGQLLQRQGCRFGIITALAEEFAAMRTMFQEEKEHSAPNDPNDYFLGTIPALDGSGSHLVALTLLKDKGNNTAAAAATHLLRSFRGINEILMVGIAGGCPNPDRSDRHVRLGDIVVSNKEGVIQYDNIKLEADSVSVRSSASTPSALLVGKVNMLEADRKMGQRPWEKYIAIGEQKIQNGKRPDREADKLFYWAGTPKEIKHPADSDRVEGMPKIHCGRIGAANALLKNPKVRDLLRDKANILAAEMEGSGIADGTWIDGKWYILIRGICDYCDPAKGDTWHQYAAIVAAAYARALLEKIPVSGEAN